MGWLPQIQFAKLHANIYAFFSCAGNLIEGNVDYSEKMNSGNEHSQQNAPAALIHLCELRARAQQTTIIMIMKECFMWNQFTFQWHKFSYYDHTLHSHTPYSHHLCWRTEMVRYARSGFAAIDKWACLIAILLFSVNHLTNDCNYEDDHTIYSIHIINVFTLDF